MTSTSRGPASDEQLVAVLRVQKWRVLAELVETPTLDADPILRDDESLDCEAYTDLVYELHHVHLPELAAAGFVRFDPESGDVTRGPLFEEIRPHLERVDER